MTALQVIGTLGIGLLSLAVIAAGLGKAWRMARAVKAWEARRDNITESR